MEHRLSRVEGMLNDLYSALENAYQGHVNPKMGYLLIGRYEGAKCIFKNPSKLQCALCPYYVSKAHRALAIPKDALKVLEKIILLTSRGSSSTSIPY